MERITGATERARGARDGDDRSTGVPAADRRRVGGRGRRRHLRGRRPVHRRGRRDRRRGRSRGRRARRRRGSRRVRGLGADAAGRAPADLPPRGRPARGPHARRSSTCSHARPARASASGCSRCMFVPSLFRQAAALAYAPMGQIIPSDTGRVRDGDPQAGRRRRRARAVERGADPLGALDRGPARARERGRAEAVGVVAVHRRPALGRDLRRGGPPRRRPQHRHARSRRGRRR